MPEHQLWIRPVGTAPPRATILFVPPLFEEANRTRRTLVLAMQALADKGFAAVLPDLPGQNDSLVATEAIDLKTWRAALAEIAARIEGPVLVAAIRGGCLIDNLIQTTPNPPVIPAHVERSRDTQPPITTPTDVSISTQRWKFILSAYKAVEGLDMSGSAREVVANPRPLARWRLAPIGGASLLRTLLRARVASDREAGIVSTHESLLAIAAHEPLLLAGNLLSPAMIAQLGQAEPTAASPLRTVTLGTGEDAIPGTPLWLRAEPGEDRAMANAIADDIAAWSKTCGIT